MTEPKRSTAVASALNLFNTSTTRGIGAVLLLLIVVAGFRSSQHKAQTCTGQLTDPALSADDGNDVTAVDKYKAAVAGMLENERFDELDCLANSLRASQERFAGGMWKLHILYWGLESPLQHATEKDWSAHLKRLKRWVSGNPESITARIALAEAYMKYAWDARGPDSSDTVSNNGWRLFAERAKEAKQVLDKASTLKAKCPEWYVAMESVALAEGWDRQQERALVEQAIAAEPGYYYVYRMYSTYLLPKWYGEDGDTEKFAAEIADRIGGEKGDAVYFQIAGYLVCNCDDQPQLTRMSWPRIQKGFAGLEKEYGTSLTNLNQLALMAVKLKDSVVADRAFQRIGEQWSEATWKKETNFETSKTWAAQTAPAMAVQASIENEAEANLRAAEGPRYQAALENKVETLMQACVAKSGDKQSFEIFILVGTGGTVQRLMTNPSTPVSDCLFQTLMNFQMSNTAPFPAPPRGSYWVRFNLDPAGVLRPSTKSEPAKS